MLEANFTGAKIRPVAPWNKWGSGVGFRTYALFEAYISELSQVCNINGDGDNGLWGVGGAGAG